MSEKFENRYPIEKAQDEASLMQEKIKKGEAIDYDKEEFQMIFNEVLK